MLLERRGSERCWGKVKGCSRGTESSVLETRVLLDHSGTLFPGGLLPASLYGGVRAFPKPGE